MRKTEKSQGCDGEWYKEGRVNEKDAGDSHVGSIGLGCPTPNNWQRRQKRTEKKIT